MVFQVAQDRELVQCATHKVQRLAKFCTSEFIYNADRIPVDVLYRCNSSSICTRPANSAAGGGILNNNFSTTDNVQDRRMTSERLQLLEGASAAAAASSGDANNNASSTNQNAKGRYYDLSSQNTQRVGPKKVCWACGMSDHEKPTCPNILCKRCHGKYRQDGAPSSTEFSGGHHNHVCEDPILSPFILLDDTLLKDNAQLMTSVRCVRCDQFGHFDCSTIEDVEAAKAYNGSLSAADSAVSGTTTATLSMAAKQMSGLLVPHCSYCGAKGHHGFDCPKQDFPDRWVQGVRAAGRRAGFTDSSVLSSSSSFAASGPYNNFNSSAAAPQQIASSATTVGQPTHRRYNPQGAVGAANAAYNSAANSYTNNNNYNSNYNNSYNNNRNSNFVAMENSFGGGGGGGGAYVQSARYQRDQQGYAQQQQQQYGSGAHYQNNNNRNSNSNSQWRQGYVAPQQQQQQQQQEYYTQPRSNQNSSYGGGGRGDATRDTNRSSRHSNNRYAERDSYNNSNNNNKSSHHQHRSQDRKRRRYSSSDDEDRMQF